MFHETMFYGKGNKKSAMVYAPLDMIDDLAQEQIRELVDNPALSEANLAFMPDTHGGKGATIGTTIKFNSLEEMKVNPEWVGNDISCISGDTEVLTKNGWIKISEYKNQEILNYDKDSGKSHFEKPLKYIVEPCEEFYHFKSSKGLDQVVSKDHRMLVYKGYKSKGYNVETMTAEELTKKPLEKRYYGFQTSFLMGGEGIELSDDEIRLDIMIAADGHISYVNENTGMTRYSMHFKKERKIERAKHLLDKAGIGYDISYSANNTTYINFSYRNNVFLKDLKRYYLANEHQLRIVAEESLKWDGHTGYRSFFSSNEEDSADVIQLAFSGSGTRAGWHTVNYENKDSTRSNNYVVSPCKNNIVGYTPDYKIIPSIDGKKYCFTTSTGYFVARRNKKIFITGNCSVAVFRLGKKEDINLDLDKIDELAQELHKPVGHKKAKKWLNESLYTEVFSKNVYKKALANLGRISGGNHFMEIGEMDGTYYLTIHNGSLFLGAQVYKEFVGRMESNKVDTKPIIEALKEQGYPQMIQPVLEIIGEQERVNKEERRYLKTDDLEEYLEAMEVCNDYALANQLAVADRVFETLDIPGTVLGLLTERAVFNGKDAFRRTKHNYVDKDNFTVYKGAASAQEGEDVLIPINMRDGLIVAKGKGNKGWNEAAPHGAGRLLSRTKAKQNIELGTYLEQMKDVRSISINEKTLDEAPDAYKSMDYILEQIQDTAEVVGVIKPVYNFKVAEDEPHWVKAKRLKKESNNL